MKIIILGDKKLKRKILKNLKKRLKTWEKIAGNGRDEEPYQVVQELENIIEDVKKL